MNRKHLLALRSDIEAAIAERRALGEYNADSKHMLFLLNCLRELTNDAIAQKTPEQKK